MEERRGVRATMAEEKAALEELRAVRSGLMPRPSPEELAQAQESVSNSDTQLIEELEQLMLTVRADTLESAQFASLQALRESRLRREAEARSRAPLALLHLDEQHRHYERLIMAAEQALFLTPHADTSPPVSPPPTAPGAEPEWQDKKPLVATTPAHTQGKGTAVAPQSSLLILPPRLLAGLQETGASGSHMGGAGSSGRQADPAPGMAPHSELPPVDLLARLLAEASACASPSLDLTTPLRHHPLDTLPDVLDQLPTLTQLRVAEHRLPTLPDSLGRMHSLQSLDAAFNRITALPSTMGALAHLTHLDLRSNRLEELPPELGQCSALRYLNVASNRLTALPEALGGLAQLETLLASLNHLRGLPTSMGGCSALTHLDVHFNEIKDVPEALGHCHQLRRLDLGSNFAELSALPATLGELRLLEELTLSHNSLRALPDSLARLPHLRRLHLEGCPLRYPPKDVVAQGTSAALAFLADQIAVREAHAAAAKRRGPLRRLLAKMRGRKPKELVRIESVDDLKRLA